MESPEDRGPPATSSPDSTARESPFLRFLSNLTPISSAPCTQRVLETNLPTTPLVFASPQIDQQRETHFLRRIETDAAGPNACHRFDSETNSVSVSWSRHDVQSCSPSGNTDDYIAEPVEVERAERAKNAPQLTEGSFTVAKVATGEVGDGSDDTTREAGPLLQDDFRKDLPSKSLQLVNYLGETNGLAESNIIQGHQTNQGQASNQQQLHGIRRHLQFEAALALNNATDLNCSNSSKMQVPVPSLHETRGTLTITQENPESLGPPSSSFQDECTRRKGSGGNSPLVPFPFCFGINLNNIARSESVSSDKLAGNHLVGHLSPQNGSMMPQIGHCSPEELANSSTTRSQTIPDSMPSADGESQALVLASLEPYNSKALGDSMHFELQHLPGNGRLDPKSADEIEALSQTSAKGNKKRQTGSTKSEECKRCNCKRSKCLKLYCDCFAAGVYCVDSCACENCLNKPEYEDIVLDTRHQIEQRNPLAFTPKIVDTGPESLANAMENKNWSTPSSARHKRGCNCKKSKCLKKYCECYQANVGCSDGCRCEDCKNTFGRKKVFVEPMIQTTKRLKSPSHKKFAAEATSDSVKNDITDKLPPTHEEFNDKGQGTLWLNSQSKALASSSSFNSRKHKQTAVESCKRSDEFPCSAIKPCDMISDSTPKMFKENCVSNDATEAGNSNQKDASQTLSLNSFLQSRRKFILQSVPSFPPLTPYSNSKDGLSNQKG